MPQMNPILWLLLFTFFITILILTNTLNYFFNFQSISSNFSKNTPSTKIWKW